MGSFPIRDIVSSLPDDGDQLAAGTCLTRLTIGHHSLRRAEDGQAKSIADARNLIHADVAAQSRRRYSLERADHRLPRAGILEPHAQQMLAIVAIDRLVVLYEVVLL